MADRYWVNDDADGDWEGTNNWSTTDGGSGGAATPTTSDAVYFTSSVTDNCTLSAAASCASLSIASGYSGDLSFTWSSYTFDCDGNFTFSGSGDLAMGNATVTVDGDFTCDGSGTAYYNSVDLTVGGDFDIEDQTTNNLSTSSITLTGTTKTLTAGGAYFSTLEISGTYTDASGSDLYHAHGSGSTTIKNGGSLAMSNSAHWWTAAGAGGLTIENGGTLVGPTTTNRNMQYRSTSNISGSVTDANSHLYLSGAGVTLTVGATASIAAERIDFAGTSSLNTSIAIPCDLKVSTAWTGANATLTLQSNVTCQGDLILDAFDSGVTATIAPNNYDLTLQGDMSCTGSYTHAWTAGTGDIIFSGGGTQSIDFNDLSVDAISYQKSGGTLTLTDGFTTPSLTIESGSSGTFDNNGQNLDIDGDCTLAGSGDVDLGSGGTWDIDGHFDWSGQGTISNSSGHTVKMYGSGKNCTGVSLKDFGAIEFHGDTSLSEAHVSGAMTVKSGVTCTIPSGAITSGGLLTIESTGVLTASLNLNVYADGGIANSGSITGSLYVTVSGGTISGTGTYSHKYMLISPGVSVGACTLSQSIWVDIKNSGAGNGTVTFSGNCTFQTPVYFVVSGAGNLTIDNSGNYDIDFEDDVTVTESSTGVLAWTKGTGLITLSPSVAVDIDFNDLTIEDVEIDATGTVTLTGGMSPDNLTLTAGTLDLDTYDVTTAAYTQAAGTTLTADNVAPGRITTSGNVDINGTGVSGCTVSYAEFDVGGTGDADYTTVSNSDASAGNAIDATDNCTDGTGNTNWTFSTGYTLTAASGSFSLSGVAADLLRGFYIDAGYGTFTLNGQAVGLVADRTVPCATGAFSLTGQDAGLLAGRTISADVGAFSLTGQDASLLRDAVLTSSTGEFTLTGQDVALTWSGLTIDWYCHPLEGPSQERYSLEGN